MGQGEIVLIEIMRSHPCADGMGDGHGEKGIGLPADWIGMGQGGILLGPPRLGIRSQCGGASLG
jgi:hypothetical protein